MFDIEKLAALARLHINESEKDALTEQLADMVRFAHTLSEVASENAPEQWEDALSLEQLREDEPQPSLPREDLLALAPQQLNGCYYVPKVVKQEDAE